MGNVPGNLEPFKEIFAFQSQEPGSLVPGKVPAQATILYKDSETLGVGPAVLKIPD